MNKRCQILLRITVFSQNHCIFSEPLYFLRITVFSQNYCILSESLYFLRIAVFYQNHCILSESLSELGLIKNLNAIRTLEKLLWLHIMLISTSQFWQENTCVRVFFNKVAVLQSCNSFKKRLQHRCFLLNFPKFLKIIFFIEHH